MTTIALIVTGILELDGMGASLKTLFPGVTFRVEKVHSITSTKVSSPPAGNSLMQGKPAWNLVDRLLREVTKSRVPGEEPADFAIAIDDVELCNLPPHGDPSHIITLVRRTVYNFLEAQFPNQAARERHARRFREQCSFHLLSPMIESYFFGEPAALRRAGVPEGTMPRLRAGDLEQFLADDPRYSSPASAAWRTRRDQRTRATPSLNPDQHPKDYLDFLRDPTNVPERDAERISLAALTSLAWPTLTMNPAELPFLRSLLADIAEAAGTPSPLGDGPPSSITWFDPKERGRAATLRNL